jgi:hypothetical protein
MAPFLTILGIVMLGSTLFFAINSPSKDEFSFASRSFQFSFQPFLTLFQTMLGMDGSVEIEESTSWLAVLMIVLFMGFVVVVL